MLLPDMHRHLISILNLQFSALHNAFYLFNEGLVSNAVYLYNTSIVFKMELYFKYRIIY